jgi:N utilization substance protein B
MASRRKGRILAFQALYSWEVSHVSVEELVKFAWLEDKKIEDLKDILDFSRVLITGTIENIEDVDKMIKDHLENWDISRVNRVDLAVLRISTYTLMYQNEFPPSIVIDEAIGICREYGADESFKFVNGVLDSIRKTVELKRKEKEKA